MSPPKPPWAHVQNPKSGRQWTYCGEIAAEGEFLFGDIATATRYAEGTHLRTCASCLAALKALKA
jgi:hypothetical protein